MNSEKTMKRKLVELIEGLLVDAGLIDCWDKECDAEDDCCICDRIQEIKAQLKKMNPKKEK